MTPQKPAGKVYVVLGMYGEGEDVLAVTTSKSLANVAIASDKAIKSASGRAPCSQYNIRKFDLDTVKGVTCQ